jgi:hypothetical protein
MNAPTIAECNKAIDAIVEAYEEKYPKATKSLVDGRDKLSRTSIFQQRIGNICARRIRSSRRLRP